MGMGGGGGGPGINRADVQGAMEAALAQHSQNERNRPVDDDPWEITHTRPDDAKVATFGRSLLNSNAMREGREAMPDAPYVGTRGLQEGDIRKRKLEEEKGVPGQPGYQYGHIQSTGDDVVLSKQSKENSTDTLRTQYGEANPADVVPTKRQQIMSDIMFDSFNTVLPGFGNGMANKMFLMEEERDEKIIGAPPLAEPRPWIGPIQGPDVPPFEWRESFSRDERKQIYRRKMAQYIAEAQLERRVGTGSLNILGDDVGFLRDTSDRGLPRPRESVLEPVVVNSAPWQPVKIPTGYELNAVRMRSVHDAMRMPNKIQPSMAQNGGPTFPTNMAHDVMYSLPAMT